jgi:hypothetical protein
VDHAYRNHRRGNAQMIVLTGLTPKQKQICQSLWELDSLAKVEAFCVLGGPEVRAMRDYLVAAVLDERTDVSNEVKEWLTTL